MAVPFIRGFPNGRRSLQEVLRSPDIQLKANEFIAHNGRYLIHITKDDRVDLIAIIDVDGEAKDVAQESTVNGPELLEAVDRLVLESVKHIPNDARLRAIMAPANNP
ncbi:MAG: hypothetical protein KGL39_46025 [Patescibacteria group bacterium]|nr:hypothetical protein [Patescibacteria group bacterium]